VVVAAAAELRRPQRVGAVGALRVEDYYLAGKRWRLRLRRRRHP